MTMARAKRRAVSGSTAFIASLSRRCRCQSSGLVMVICMKSSARGQGGRFSFLLEFQRALVELVLSGAGDFSGELHRLLQRELIEKQPQHAQGVFLLFDGIFAASFHQKHELTTPAVVVLLQPGTRFRKPANMNLFEHL